MLHLETAPVFGSPFEKIINAVQWDQSVDTEKLAVVRDHDLLVIKRENTFSSLVLFSELEADEDVVKVPRSVEEVRDRIGSSALGMINGDWTAKGLGYTGANSPLAIHHPGEPVKVVARSLLLWQHGDEIMKHQENNSKLALKLQWMRHAGLIAGAGIGDMLSSNYAGTRKAMAFMEQNYGDARVVVRNAPPTWQAEQAKLGIKSEIPPKKILVRPLKTPVSDSVGSVGPNDSLHAIGSVYPQDLLR